MFEIKELLFKRNNALLLQEITRQEIQKTIFETTGILVILKNIEIKNAEIFLKIRPIEKNEIFLKKEKIIKELTKKINKNAPREIK